MEIFSKYQPNIHTQLASISGELNRQLNAIDRNDDRFEKVNTFGKRPIICWTYECNILCPGCYAQKLKQDFAGQTMPTHEFGRTLDLYQQTLTPQFDGVTLLGGEPTQPNTFPDLLGELEKRNLRASMYTNGINLRNPAILNRIIESPSIDQVTMHFQTPHLDDSSYLQRMDELKKRGKTVIARHDFHGLPREVDAILEKVASLGLPLSWSFTHPYDLPEGQTQPAYTRPREFKALSERLHYFFQRADQMGVKLMMGIPVPLCAFQKGDWEEYRKRWELKYDCIGVGDVHPNGQMSQCTVVPQISTLGKVETPKQLATIIRFFQKHHRRLRQEFTSFQHCNPGCRLSHPERYKLCSGGCTAYRLYGNHR